MSAAAKTKTTEENVIGFASDNSPGAKQRRERHAEATAARDAGEIAGLYAAYEKTVEERAQVEEALMKVLALRAGDAGHAIGQGEPIRAIRDVALAAIELAKQVALASKE